jgi:hypothetical protein
VSRRAWEAALAEHRDALEGFLRVAGEAPEARWTAAAKQGAWSPSEVAEHLSLTYEAVLGELDGGPPVAPRARGWQQAVFRWTILPHILFHRTFPVRVRAPREVRPAERAVTPGGREAGLRRLRSLGETFGGRVAGLADRDARTVAHPYFGPISLRRAVRFAAAHIEHHTRQINV